MTEPDSCRAIPSDLTDDYLKQWLSGPNAMLIRKLINNDPEVRDVQLPSCLNSDNLARALNHGGLLIKIPPHSQRSYDYFNLLSPGRGDTRHTELTIPDGGADIDVKKSRTQLAFPPGYFRDDLPLPKVCVFQIDAKLELLLFYKGNNQKRPKRSSPAFNEDSFIDYSNCGDAKGVVQTGSGMVDSELRESLHLSDDIEGDNADDGQLCDEHQPPNSVMHPQTMTHSNSSQSASQSTSAQDESNMTGSPLGLPDAFNRMVGLTQSLGNDDDSPNQRHSICTSTGYPPSGYEVGSVSADDILRLANTTAARSGTHVVAADFVKASSVDMNKNISHGSTNMLCLRMADGRILLVNVHSAEPSVMQISSAHEMPNHLQPNKPVAERFPECAASDEVSVIGTSELCR